MKTTINIRSGKLLDPFLKDYILARYPEYKFATEEEVNEKIKLFKEAWGREGKKLLKAIYKATKLKFKTNIIDCYIVSAITKDMSAPLIIRSRYTEEEFVDVLIHELIHKLFVDNKVKKIKGIDEPSTTVSHIQLFAILKYLYLDVLKDIERLERVIAKSQVGNNEEYAKAWEIVEEMGYREIIQEI